MRVPHGQAICTGCTTASMVSPSCKPASRNVSNWSSCWSSCWPLKARLRKRRWNCCCASAFTSRTRDAFGAGSDTEQLFPLGQHTGACCRQKIRGRLGKEPKTRTAIGVAASLRSRPVDSPLVHLAGGRKCVPRWNPPHFDGFTLIRIFPSPNKWTKRYMARKEKRIKLETHTFGLIATQRFEKNPISQLVNL